jgi:hypothetical protein
MALREEAARREADSTVALLGKRLDSMQRTLEVVRHGAVAGGEADFAAARGVSGAAGPSTEVCCRFHLGRVACKTLTCALRCMLMQYC